MLAQFVSTIGAFVLDATVGEIRAGDLQLTFAENLFETLFEFQECTLATAHLDVIDMVCAYEVNVFRLPLL